MSREEKINKMIEEIKMRRNDEQYSGGPFPIYHIEFDILNEEIERLHSIIKEAKEYIYENAYDSERQNCIDDLWGEIPKLLEILDKGDEIVSTL